MQNGQKTKHQQMLIVVVLCQVTTQAPLIGAIADNLMIPHGIIVALQISLFQIKFMSK